MTKSQKKANLLHTVVLLGIFCSCSTKSETSVFSSTEYTPTKDVEVLNMKDFDYDAIIDSEVGEYRYSELYSKVNYVKLEASEEAVLGHIQKMEVIPNGDFIVFDWDRQIIARYDSTGHFLNLIGNVGKAHNEYIRPTDFAYDPFKNEIAIVANRSIKIYNIEGEFQNDIYIGKPFCSIGFIDENLIAVFFNHGDLTTKTHQAYNLIVIDRNGNTMAEYDPYTAEERKFAPPSENTFRFQNGKLTGYFQYLPTLFTFNKEQLCPIYYLDFGKWQMPIEDYRTIDCKTFVKHYDKKGMGYCMKFYETDDKIYMSIVVRRKSLMYIKKKGSLEEVFIKHIAYNDLYGKIDDTGFDYFHNNKIYNCYDPSAVEAEYKIYKNYPKDFEAMRGPVTPEDIEIMKDLMNHNNPVIQICTLKD